MQAVRRRCLGIELACEIERKHDLGELALSIGARAAISARQHDIIEVDRVLAERKDVQDAGRLAEHHEGQQNSCEQESGEIVDSKAQFVPVAGLSFTGRAARADASIVMRMSSRSHSWRTMSAEATRLCERGKICGQEGCRAAVGGPNFLEQLLASRAIVPMD